jgi:hypothetical protein
MGADLSTAITLLKGLKEFFQKVCDENGVPPELKRTRISKRKRLHDYEGEDSVSNDPEEKFYRNYFLCVLDQGILSTEERFNQLAEHKQFPVFVKYPDTEINDRRQPKKALCGFGSSLARWRQ